MNMRTPLGKVRGLGSAKEGTTHFWHQRLSGLANVPLTLFLVWLIISLAGADHAQAASLLSSPLVAIGTILTVLSMTIHMRLGMQVVIEDYVHAEGTKFLLLMLNTFFTFAIAVTGIFAILKLAFGG
ncbi:MAG: succinate dehydrogenase, hydrophobic membrane anchor protein [Rhizobiaceae bacterium]